MHVLPSCGIFWQKLYIMHIMCSKKSNCPIDILKTSFWTVEINSSLFLLYISLWLRPNLFFWEWLLNFGFDRPFPVENVFFFWLSRLVCSIRLSFTTTSHRTAKSQSGQLNNKSLKNYPPATMCSPQLTSFNFRRMAMTLPLNSHTGFPHNSRPW